MQPFDAIRLQIIAEKRQKSAKPAAILWNISDMVG
jgi:hypothetical protein